MKEKNLYHFGDPEGNAKNVPSHVVVETSDRFTIDGFELDYVLNNGVTVQQLGENLVQVNVSFLAKSYDYEFKEGTRCIKRQF